MILLFQIIGNFYWFSLIETKFTFSIFDVNKQWKRKKRNKINHFELIFSSNKYFLLSQCNEKKKFRKFFLVSSSIIKLTTDSDTIYCSSWINHPIHLFLSKSELWKVILYSKFDVIVCPRGGCFTINSHFH